MIWQRKQCKVYGQLSPRFDYILNGWKYFAYFITDCCLESVKQTCMKINIINEYHTDASLNTTSSILKMALENPAHLTFILKHCLNCT